MKQDALKQYVSLRDSIFSEREELITRLREIDEALGAMGLRGRDTYYGPPHLRPDVSAMNCL